MMTLAEQSRRGGVVGLDWWCTASPHLHMQGYLLPTYAHHKPVIGA